VEEIYFRLRCTLQGLSCFQPQRKQQKSWFFWRHNFSWFLFLFFLFFCFFCFCFCFCFVFFFSRKESSRSRGSFGGIISLGFCFCFFVFLFFCFFVFSFLFLFFCFFVFLFFCFFVFVFSRKESSRSRGSSGDIISLGSIGFHKKIFLPKSYPSPY